MMDSDSDQNVRQGLIHLYCGDGKGKTTAAIGLIVRAAGHGRRAMLVQFLKSGLSGEIGPLSKLEGVRIISGQITAKFSNQMDEQERAQTLKLHQEHLQKAVAAAAAGELDLLVLDEAMGAITAGLLSRTDLVEFLRHKPAELEVVLTGRNPPEEIMELADYISEMKCLRHPYERGFPAREGVEF
ncbi:MAG: cob(I)yrinic acid a,c-diamide adenosyltransferase [Eubacteriales bacterium]|jgi:cob(I)alamin adenosyltransferase|nr:cob(I)yrinic acid a,c-diamide adenosyltransferase [Eubacteriales bacterium]MDD3503443.1 cob(I)yrinic acid a,c-diamide adenosyltransferase [Eubacteriales bacterium]MDD4682370.1 cob(I)yrinic acid a,c-diamide adenosyltransferase [Eubacteriales bacterium]